MKIGIPKEVCEGETRVALTPNLIAMLKKDKHEVLVEKGAGAAASFSDDAYTQAGATIVDHPSDLYNQADMIFKVQPPQEHPSVRKHEADMIREGTSYIGFIAPFNRPDGITKLTERKVTAYAMEFVPRITRAQSMDALSSQANLAGYKAVLIAADCINKIFPLMMTAAGTISPSVVLILGAGVAGLQAIATAKRLGAKVEAFDPRPAVRDQVRSLGATFIEMEMPKDAETSGGYAKELSPEFIKKEMEAIAARLPKVDVVISTAQVFGKRAPLLMTKEMVEMMKPGSIIVDLAAEQGGNCELTQAGQNIDHNGVTIIGAMNLPATIPIDSSQMYARNVLNLFRHLYPKPDVTPDVNDEIVKGACLTRDGEIVNENVKNAVKRT